ncbi:MAG TPA: hypothetical protein VKX31_00355 [Brumimicrobium sp.]|nr:hypothetical protein [Brumimicrobium sp.]
MRYIVSSALIALTLLLSCSDSKKTASEKAKGDLSLNFAFDVEIINNQMPSLSPNENTAYCIVNLSPKTGVFEANWKIKKFVFNTVSYFTFDDNELKGKGEKQYINNVREITLEEKNRIVVIFENDKKETIQFSVDNVPVLVVH